MWSPGDDDDDGYCKEARGRREHLMAILPRGACIVGRGDFDHRGERHHQAGEEDPNAKPSSYTQKHKSNQD